MLGTVFAQFLACAARLERAVFGENGRFSADEALNADLDPAGDGDQ
jgi:hypothetical protein